MPIDATVREDADGLQPGAIENDPDGARMRGEITALAVMRVAQPEIDE